MQMDFSLFSPDATVDWLELEVRTQEKHVAWRVQKASAGTLSYVTGLDPVTGHDIRFTGEQGANTPTTRFAIRIQAPERFTAITAALATISDINPLATILVRSIEAAIDAYRLKGTTDKQLAEMAAYLLRTINRPEGSNEAPRFYSWRGTPDLRYGEEQVLAAILDGKTAMFGNEGDNYVVRGYVKNYDTLCVESDRNRRVTIANNLEHRARIEVRLQGECCPVRTLDDLKTFKFESLARPYFKFHEPEDNLEAIETLLAGKVGSLGSVVNQTGETIAAHANRGRSRKTRRGSQASPLNEEARDQLRNLTLRWRSKSERTRRRHYGNSGSKGNSDTAPNYLNDHPIQHTESAGPTRQIPALLPFPETPQARPCDGDVLNTSLSLPQPQPADPIKVVFGDITSPDLHHAQGNFHQATHPVLPTLTDKEG